MYGCNMARSQRRAEGGDLVEAEMPIVAEATPDILASLSEMTVSQLTDVIRRAEAVRSEKIESEKSAFLQRIRSEAQAFGMSLEEMIRPPAPAPRRGRGTATRARPPAKYRYPESENTWSGRGRIPRWLAALEADGHNRNEYLIEKPAAQ
jgi:DNA-binding protein H-NS